MTREEAMEAMGWIVMARQGAEVDDETKARLKEDFDKLTNYLKIRR